MMRKFSAQRINQHFFHFLISFRDQVNVTQFLLHRFCLPKSTGNQLKLEWILVFILNYEKTIRYANFLLHRRLFEQHLIQLGSICLNFPLLNSFLWRIHKIRYELIFQVSPSSHFVISKCKIMNDTVCNVPILS